MSRLRGTAAGAAVAFTLLLSACTATDPETSRTQDPTPEPAIGASSEPAPVPPAPRAGACYRLTVRQASAPTSETSPVPCSSRHTARTIFVGTLDLLVDGHSVAVDSARAQQQLASACPQRLAEFLGGDPETRALSRFQVVWFSPTLEEADLGAAWFRCDVVAFGNAERLLPFPSTQRLRGVLDRPGALGTYGLCGTAQPGSPSFERVACAFEHSWRALSTIDIPGRRYPGADAAREAGDDACADQARAEQGLPLEFQYGWEWPTAAQWRAGQHYGICWVPA